MDLCFMCSESEAGFDDDYCSCCAHGIFDFEYNIRTIIANAEGVIQHRDEKSIERL